MQVLCPRKSSGWQTKEDAIAGHESREHSVVLYVMPPKAPNDGEEKKKKK
jgi:hypothetical protein